MGKSHKRSVSYRMPDNYYQNIHRNFLSKNYTMSDFLTDAVREKLHPKNFDIDLVAKSLTAIRKSVEEASRERDLLLLFMNQFVEYFFLYHNEIDEDNIRNIVASGGVRYEKFFNKYKRMIADQSKTFIHDLYREISEELKD